MCWPRVGEANPLFSVYIALWRSTALAIIYNVVGRQRNLGLPGGVPWGLDWQNGNYTYRIQNTELTHSHDCIKFSNGSFSLLLRNFNWWMIFCFQSRSEVDMFKNPGRKISPILNLSSLPCMPQSCLILVSKYLFNISLSNIKYQIKRKLCKKYWIIEHNLF